MQAWGREVNINISVRTPEPKLLFLPDNAIAYCITVTAPTENGKLDTRLQCTQVATYHSVTAPYPWVSA